MKILESSYIAVGNSKWCGLLGKQFGSSLKVKHRANMRSVAQSWPTLCDPIDCRPPGYWNFPGKNTGVDCHFLLQELPYNWAILLHRIYPRELKTCSHKNKGRKIKQLKENYYSFVGEDSQCQKCQKILNLVAKYQQI